jgi:hypothetical protein
MSPLDLQAIHNSDMTTQFVTERLLTLQLCATWNLVHVVTASWCCAVVYQNGVVYFEKKCFECEQNHSATLIQRCFVRIRVKKNWRENPFTSGTSHLLKLVVFILRRKRRKWWWWRWRRRWWIRRRWRRRIRVGDHVTRLWSVFLRRFSVVRRNLQSVQAGNFVMSLIWQCGTCYVSDCLASSPDFNCCRSWSPVMAHPGTDLSTDVPPRTEQFVFG